MASQDVKVYTVNGAAVGSSSALPDWLTRKRAGKGKRAVKEHYEGTLELIQGLEFPEASNKIRTTRDGTHVVATGTYKPQMRVWDLEQLSLKFERHTDAENVDFVMLSNDWTKSIQLQNDRSLELHTQGGFHYRTRIPRFGRCLAYHFPSCDALVGASGNEVYRLNLEQGRFMTPLELDGAEGVNAIDINPAHQLWAFGIDGNGSVQFWDPRARASVGVLKLPGGGDLSVTAIASRADGLTYAIGTTTGHTLLYDIRSSRSFASKDQGYGLPIKSLSWIEGGSRMAGDGMVLSADKKVIKIWDRNTPDSNFVSITPATDLNDVHHLPGSGLIMTANEGIKMGTYYVPQLGPAPKWASFLENVTEEMEDQVTRSVYEDYKFVEKSELKALGLDHLVGSAALKPYMHGYFVALKLYEAARLIANPFAYEEHREKMMRDKMDKLAETRIRTKKATPSVKVNKGLAEKIARDEEREAKKAAKRKRRAEDEMAVDAPPEAAEKATLLSDPRFAQVFENPEFQIDEESREYALLNPSSAFQRSTAKTAVESEDEASEKGSSSDEDEEEQSNSDSDDDDLMKSRRLAPEMRQPNVKMVPMRLQGAGRGHDRSATFGQRRNGKAPVSRETERESAKEISWVPSSSDTKDERAGKTREKKVERFGSGMERGGESPAEMAERERKGRTQRRQGVRSGSKNVFRHM